MTSGPGNAITDIKGVLIGQYERIGEGWATGTTVVLVPEGAVGGVDSRGGAPGTRETTLLQPWNLVQRVHGVCLSGGSAYGLAAADGVMRWLAERDYGFPVGDEPHQVVPIVPAAVLFDLPRSEWGNRPDAAFGYAASEAASAGTVAQGCVGAGTGAKVGSLKGGVGTASVVLSSGAIVGALAVVNAYGEAVDLTTGRPWALDSKSEDQFHLQVPGRPASLGDIGSTDLNTTIGVVATDAALDKAECHRLAASAQDGLARAVRPAHSMFDGDTVFALSTCTRSLASEADNPAGSGRVMALDQVYMAAAEVFARAVMYGMLAAWSMAGLTAYRDAWPGALP